MKINRPGKIIDINYIAALPVSELEIRHLALRVLKS